MSDNRIAKLEEMLHSDSIRQQVHACAAIAESDRLLSYFLTDICKLLDSKFHKLTELTRDDTGLLTRVLISVVRGIDNSNDNSQVAVDSANRILASGKPEMTRALIVTLKFHCKSNDFVFDLLSPLLNRKDKIADKPLLFLAGEAVSALLHLDLDRTMAMHPVYALRQLEKTLIFALEIPQAQPFRNITSTELETVRACLQKLDSD